MTRKALRIAVFLTWDVSLAMWREKGILERELRTYRELAKRGVETVFISWGGAEDEQAAAVLGPGLRVVSVYKFMRRPRRAVPRFFYSLLAPWVLRRELREVDILKTHQMWGGWVPALARLTSGKKLVVRNGFDLYALALRHGSGRGQRAGLWLMSRIVYGAADHICVASPEDRDFVIDCFDQPAAKISIHPFWTAVLAQEPGQAAAVAAGGGGVLSAGRAGRRHDDGERQSLQTLVTREMACYRAVLRGRGARL